MGFQNLIRVCWNNYCPFLNLILLKLNKKKWGDFLDQLSYTSSEERSCVMNELKEILKEILWGGIFLSSTIHVTKREVLSYATNPSSHYVQRTQKTCHSVQKSKLRSPFTCKTWHFGEGGGNNLKKIAHKEIDD